MATTLQILFENRPEEVEENNASAEVETEVFRNQYIPQTLEQVYDVERDVGEVAKGGQDSLVYRDLLAEKLAPEMPVEDEGKSASVLEDDNQDSSDSEGEGDDEVDPFAKKAPRGKRFEDKDAKKDHKKQVKEEKKEQREKKIPKKVKKQMISGSARRKH